MSSIMERLQGSSLTITANNLPRDGLGGFTFKCLGEASTLTPERLRHKVQSTSKIDVCAIHSSLDETLTRWMDGRSQRLAWFCKPAHTEHVKSLVKFFTYRKRLAAGFQCYPTHSGTAVDSSLLLALGTQLMLSIPAAKATIERTLSNQPVVLFPRTVHTFISAIKRLLVDSAMLLPVGSLPLVVVFAMPELAPPFQDGPLIRAIISLCDLLKRKRVPLKILVLSSYEQSKLDPISPIIDSDVLSLHLYGRILLNSSRSGWENLCQLQATEAAYDSPRRQFLRSSLPTAPAEALANVFHWLEDTVHPICWLTAERTSVAYDLAKHCAEQETLAASVFCATTTATFLVTIALQVTSLEEDSEARLWAKRVLLDNPKIPNLLISADYAAAMGIATRLIVPPLAQRCAESGRPLVIVLDYGSGPRNDQDEWQNIKLLSEVIRDSGINVRLFVASSLDLHQRARDGDGEFMRSVLSFHVPLRSPVVKTVSLTNAQPVPTVYHSAQRQFQAVVAPQTGFNNSHDLKDLTGQISRVEGEPHPFAFGGYAQVTRGRWTDPSTSIVKEVAVKEIFARGNNGPWEMADKLRRRLFREASLWQKLRHPNVLLFLGICNDFGPRPALVSPYCRLGSVMNYLETHPKANRLGIVTGLTAGLDYLHSQNVVHGDLKGENLLIKASGIPCICDLGISKVINMSGYTTGFSGTPPFMAPELFSSVHQVSVGVTTNAIYHDDEDYFFEPATTKKSDVYAYGLLALQIVTNLPPLTSRLGMAASRESQQLLRPSRQRYDPHFIMNERLWKVLEQCCLWDPDERPAIGEVVAQINEVEYE